MFSQLSLLVFQSMRSFTKIPQKKIEVLDGHSIVKLIDHCTDLNREFLLLFIKTNKLYCVLLKEGSLVPINKYMDFPANW